MAPLLASLALFVFFCAIVFQWMWLALATLIVTFVIGCWWMWPRTEKEVA